MILARLRINNMEWCRGALRANGGAFIQMIPLSARGKTHWTEERSRGDWITRTEAFAEMTSDADNLLSERAWKPMKTIH